MALTETEVKAEVALEASQHAEQWSRFRARFVDVVNAKAAALREMEAGLVRLAAKQEALVNACARVLEQRDEDQC